MPLIMNRAIRAVHEFLRDSFEQNAGDLPSRQRSASDAVGAGRRRTGMPGDVQADGLRLVFPVSSLGRFGSLLFPGQVVDARFDAGVIAALAKASLCIRRPAIARLARTHRGCSTERRRQMKRSGRRGTATIKKPTAEGQRC
jgi:hypothetical protein